MTEKQTDSPSRQRTQPARRVCADAVMLLLKMILIATGKNGIPQGGVTSPLLSNLCLNEVDRMLEKAVESTRRGKSTNVQYARFADDIVILIDAERRSDWLVTAIDRRLREKFAKPVCNSSVDGFRACFRLVFRLFRLLDRAFSILLFTETKQPSGFSSRKSHLARRLKSLYVFRKCSSARENPGLEMPSVKRLPRCSPARLLPSLSVLSPVEVEGASLGVGGLPADDGKARVWFSIPAPANGHKSLFQSKDEPEGSEG
jgi:hypothetical protein